MPAIVNSIQNEIYKPLKNRAEKEVPFNSHDKVRIKQIQLLQEAAVFAILLFNIPAKSGLLYHHSE